MSIPANISVVIAVQHAQDNLPEIARVLNPSKYPEVEFIFCHTIADPDTPTLVPKGENVRILCGAPGSLIPHLWRDGILAATGDYVAVTTAHCIPASDWIDSLLAKDYAGLAGIGGVIANDPDADNKAWAIFFLRYISFALPRTAGRVADIAADNAVYRRAEVVRHGDLLENGFWEPSFHKRFAADGLALEFAPDLRVTHCNRYGARKFVAQRYAHGRQFGLERARASNPMRRLLLVALTPILPFVFLAKIIRAVVRKGRYTAQLVRSLPWLMLFVVAWIAGESRGYLKGLRSTR